MQTVAVAVRRLAHNRDLPLPAYETAQSAGMDLPAAVTEDIVLAPGERCASSTNRNFEGRQGAGGRTHLMSPAMVAAAAVCGRLTDVRRMED